MSKSKGKVSDLSVFDLDRTLVSVNCSFTYFFFLFKRKVFPFSSLITPILCFFRHRFFGMSLVQLHEAIFKNILKGSSIDLLEKHMDAFVKECIAHLIYTPAIARLKLAQQLGHYTVILSNSPSFLVSAIAKFFAVDEWGSSVYNLDKEDKLCNIASLMQGEDKADCVAQIAARWSLSKESITAYSDSHLDVPFLLSAGHAVAVNPDKKLFHIAKLRNWEII